MNITVKQMRAFVFVNEFESFKLAAERLSLTPGAISLLVRDLEEQVGFALFDRTTRKVSLSRAGREFLPAVLKVLRELQGAVLTANDVKNRATGIVRVAAPLVVASVILPPAMAVYHATHPNVRIRPVDCTVEDLVQMVQEDRADLAIGPDRATGTAVARVALYESPWVLWCAPNHPLAAKRRITWSALRSESVIAAGRDYENRVAQALRELPTSQHFDPTYIVDNVTTALGISAAGLGVTLSPGYVSVLAKKMGLVMKRVHDPEIVRELSLFVSNERSVGPAAAAFMDFLVPHLRSAHKMQRHLPGTQP